MRAKSWRLAAAGGALVLLSLAATTDALARATFDADAAVVRLPTDALRTWSFESPDALVGLELGAWDQSKQSFFPTLIRTPITSADQVAAFFTSGVDDAIEGAHALRLGKDGGGLVIVDQGAFDLVKNGRFELTLWGRADGTSPQVFVVYDLKPENVWSGNPSFAMVRAIRTGRQTSDGWAELSTGAIDGSVWGVGVKAITIMPSPSADAADQFLVDALQMTKVAGSPLPARACTQATVDAVCGSEADCMYGHCVASTFSWGVLPPLAHRREIAERWIQYGTRIIGDRNATQHGLALLEPQARLLSEVAPSSRQFFGGLNRLVNLLRDNHTSFGSPSNFTSFYPEIPFGSSSAIGACFGVVEKDIMGGGLGYGVFRASDTAPTGVKLAVGDVLSAIDGRDPKQWVDDNYPRFASTLPNDPASDWSTSANDLGRLISMRASTVTLLRCASASSCDANNRQEITIDIGKLAYGAMTSGTATSDPKGFGCTQRFTETVAGGGGGGFSGEDAVHSTTGPTGATLVSFDGFVGQTTWQASMRGIFNAHPAKVVMDARMGHGGYENAVQDLLDLLRGTSEPIGVVSVGRGTYDTFDPPWLFDHLATCNPSLSEDPFCTFSSNIFTVQTNPAGGASKIAWLNSNDVSANDFMPRLLQGRSSFKIFAPHPTAGAFGAIAELPGLATNWSGGSLQYQDSHFAANKAAATAARWESSHGVEPDVVVAQKLSDTLKGVDTIVTTATDWLASP